MELKLEDIKKLNIYDKLSLITNELGVVAKNLTVGADRYSYKAVGELDVLEAVKPLEHKYRVYSYPFERSIIVDKEVSVGRGDNVKFSQFIRNETTYRFVNIDNPSEFIDIKTWGDGMDTGDKATGKAMTYADKYALLKAYKISTGDDPDKNKSEDNVKTVSKEKTYIKSEQTKWLKENLDPDRLKKMLAAYNLKRIEDMEQELATTIISRLKSENE